MHPRITRRDFLAASVGTLSGIHVGGRFLTTLPVIIPMTAPARRCPPEVFFPDSPSEELLRRLAHAAMDAATAAGADFADIRIGAQRSIIVPELPYSPNASITVGFGIRAWVGGTWGFQHGSLLTEDAVATAARSAATNARRASASDARLGDRPGPAALAPVPVVNGAWRGPCVIDPFTVPMDDYYRAMGGIVETIARVHQNRSFSCGALRWQAETRVFASTEGSLVTQHFMRGGPALNGAARLPDNPADQVSIDVPGLDLQSAGFERALWPEWSDSLSAGLDDAVRLRELPYRPFQDVGRFPIVFCGAAFGNLVGMTANIGLNGDRLVGIEADASGPSFAAPLRTSDTAVPTFSPFLTVSCDRALPSTSAVAWDDEGIAPEPYTVIKEGHVVDYHTTRETASWLSTGGQLERSSGRSFHVHGSTVAVTPASLPVYGGERLLIQPSSTPINLADLTRDISHGFVIRTGSTYPDPNLHGGTVGNTMALEVVGGNVVARTNVLLQFVTTHLLKDKIVALGDSSTVRSANISVSTGIPWQTVDQRVSAPAALCKDVNIFSYSYRS